ncbi:DUF5712 family protein [Chondrinema litorale]|uniref:DUF5712 family protein n=1 Tax=Chondrinema litorale TaxID=2994555 RepID=UPI0025433DCE|nr:DUF5712 family protein [Chondrinema litorale]UZR99633.1 DUF5712 family protein [Chondrinema litorale]
MYIDFSGGSIGADNKGSVKNLTNYLEKEQKLLEKEGRSREFFFNLHTDNILKYEVDKAIDGQKKSGLGKKDAKFYMISINPSEKEQNHFKNDPEKFKNWVQKEYMPQLIRDFKRKGLESDNVNIFGKLEYNRYYKGNDDDVKNGKVKSGQKKVGSNMHVHIIIGRKSIDGKFKLSPNANSRKVGKQGAAKNAGFDRNEHKVFVEQSFDKTFNYKRDISESFALREELNKVSSVEQKAIILENYKRKFEENERSKALNQPRLRKLL